MHLHTFTSKALALLLATNFLIAKIAVAETVPTLALSSTPINAEQLGEPGRPLSLYLTLRGSKRLDFKARLFAVIDGKVSDVPASTAFQNDRDDAVYQFDIFTPAIDLSYQFFVYSADGQVSSTERFAVTRNCIPGIVSPKLEKDRTLVERATELEEQSKSYDYAIQALGEIKAKIDKNG